MCGTCQHHSWHQKLVSRAQCRFECSSVSAETGCQGRCSCGTGHLNQPMSSQHLRGLGGVHYPDSSCSSMRRKDPFASAKKQVTGLQPVPLGETKEPEPATSLPKPESISLYCDLLFFLQVLGQAEPEALMTQLRACPGLLGGLSRNRSPTDHHRPHATSMNQDLRKSHVNPLRIKPYNQRPTSPSQKPCRNFAKPCIATPKPAASRLPHA